MYNFSKLYLKYLLKRKNSLSSFGANLKTREINTYILNLIKYIH